MHFFSDSVVFLIVLNCVTQQIGRIFFVAGRKARIRECNHGLYRKLIQIAG